MKAFCLDLSANANPATHRLMNELAYKLGKLTWLALCAPAPHSVIITADPTQLLGTSADDRIVFVADAPSSTTKNASRTLGVLVVLGSAQPGDVDHIDAVAAKLNGVAAPE
jgi:hypothetical protein